MSVICIVDGFRIQLTSYRAEMPHTRLQVYAAVPIMRRLLRHEEFQPALDKAMKRNGKGQPAT